MFVHTQPVPPVDRRVGHGLHLALTILTFGFWSVIWIAVTVGVAIENATARASYRHEFDTYQQAIALQQYEAQRQYYEIMQLQRAALRPPPALLSAGSQYWPAQPPRPTAPYRYVEQPTEVIPVIRPSGVDQNPLSP